MTTAALGELVGIATLASEDEADEAIQLMDANQFISTVEAIGELQATDGSEPTRVIFLLKVMSDQVDAARQALRQAGLLHQEGRGWHCPTCGTSIEATFSACWSCGTSRIDEAIMDLPIMSSGGGSCSTGGCGCGPTGCGTGGGLVDIELSPAVMSQLQANDQLARSAYVTAIASLVLPPAVVISTCLIAKTMVKPLSAHGTRQFYTAMGLSLIAVIECGLLWNWLK